MNRRHSRSLVAGVLAAVVLAGRVDATCFCVPPPDAVVRSHGQLNFIAIDRSNDRTRLVPNIRVVGEPTDFALVVPTPEVPTLTAAEREIWTAATQLTAPVRRPDLDGMDCSTRPRADIGGTPESDTRTDVSVIAQQTVGSFDTTTLSSNDADALATWLVDNGYPLDPDELLALTPYVDANWVFTAMKLRADAVIPAGGWDTNVDPVLFEYAGTEVEIPLPAFQINMGSFLPMVFYVVDDHRVKIEGFATAYSNRFSGKEVAAVRETYPALAGYVAEGRVLTRLDATFRSPEELAQSVWIEPAGTDEEIRPTFVSRASRLPVEFALLAVPFLVLPWRWARRRWSGGSLVDPD